jgi:hypothetical protein
MNNKIKSTIQISINFDINREDNVFLYSNNNAPHAFAIINSDMLLIIDTNECGGKIINPILNSDDSEYQSFVYECKNQTGNVGEFHKTTKEDFYHKLNNE